MIKIEYGRYYTIEERNIIQKTYPSKCVFKYLSYGLSEIILCDNTIYNEEINTKEIANG